MVEQKEYNVNMIKSVYISPLHIEGLETSGANHFIVSGNGLNNENWQKLQELGFKCGIAVNALKKNEGKCLLYPEIKQRLFSDIDKILKFNPSEIWVDYFRFGGDCTGIYEEDEKLAHQPCKWCEGKNRKDTLFDLAEEVKQRIGGKSKFGFFAVAFKDEEAPNLADALGLDYAKLGQVVDIFSPMLYHRMIRKPINYISDYVKYLHEKTGKPVLPIIQIKDMPDDLEDKMSEEEIVKAFNEAIKDPSEGVCFFWWQHALEKNKTKIISKMFSSV